MSQNKPLRKSIKKAAKNGNKAKHEAYKEAFARIKAANESKFFIESVAIEEAIISDRLKSHLEHHGKLPDNSSLYCLVDAWKKLNGSKRIQVRINLPELIDQWRILRNEAVHGLVATGSLNSFLKSGNAAAKSGEILARAVCDWHKGEKRKTKTAPDKTKKPAANRQDH
jgi:hypothetical protein